MHNRIAIKEYRLIIALAAILLFTQTGFATHNRAGEITYRNLGGTNYEVTIITYTKISAPADRPDIGIFWGDGDTDTIPRTYSQPIPGTDIKRNEYKATHIYPGPADYIIYFKDENRNQGVINILGSVNVAFYVESLLTILPISLPNSSPILLKPPIDDGALNQIFIHNPNAYDPDGDSLSYELTPCRMGPGQVIPTFLYPDPANNFASNSFSINALTGDIIWDTPILIGEYNMAMIIREWRTIPNVGTINIGYVTRDLQVNIVATNNHPPIIVNVIDTCVEAGATVAYTVTATDQDNDQITLTASGGPFLLTPSPAQFTSNPANSFVTGDFLWNTECAHVQRNPYSILYLAKDNASPTSLIDVATGYIKVVGPSPKNPFAVPQANGIVLNWNQSLCSQAIGYKIYRHNGFVGFIPSQCETGVPAYTGYALIRTQTGLANTSFTDDNNGQGLATGITFCYMITAIYPDGAESYASFEVCANLKLDLPVITNVDVLTTDNSNGKIYVAWSRPSDLDTIQWQGPYRYKLQRATSVGSFADVISFTDLNDTTYIDSSLNTADIQYRYQVQFFNETNGNPILIGTTQIANSVFLSIAPGDNRLFLSWSNNVPWSDTAYVIYKQNALGLFDSLAIVSSIGYVDTAVINGNNYCYKVKSIGTYGITGLINPIINNSEEECQVPFDNEPPCVPASFSATVDCNLSVDTIRWSFGAITDSCKIDDIASFNLYFQAAGSTEPAQLLEVITNPLASFYVVSDVKNLAGCFYITITDTNGNISVPSATSCTEGCPRYVLPNFFTPDGDIHNATFHPIEYNYSDVKDIDIKIYNRWGDVLFKTTDPDINWNGKRNNTGEDVPDGVYYYTCIVNEVFLKGVKPRVLKGFIQVIRSGNGNTTPQ